MKRISDTFKKLSSEKRKGLVIFLTAGDPSLRQTPELVKAAFDNGADIVELGVPFSDPLADGPVIQASFLRAIKKGCNVTKTMKMVEKLRSSGVDSPLIFMLASSLVVTHGVKRFMKDSSQCGVDGLIIPDVPPEESSEFYPLAKNEGLDTITLAAPTSSDKRMRKIASLASGFVYYINVKGITGQKRAIAKDVSAGLKRLKKITKKPVCAGFGISDPKQAKEVARHADGIVIGSKAIQVVTESKSSQEAVKNLAKFVRQVRKGMDGA